MKKSILYIIYLLAIVVAGISCSDNVEVNYDMVENDPQYIRIGIPQDVNSPQKKSVFISDETQSFVFGVSYGGVNSAKQDIQVTLKIDEALVSVFNEANSTDYPFLPQDCFKLESNTVTIKAGTFGTEPISVNITPGDYLEVGKPYLLPITIESVDTDVTINENLRTVYYAVTGSFLPGQVPREKVFSFGTADTGLMFCKNDDIIRIDADGNMLLYQLNNEETYELSRQIGSGWGGIGNIFYMPENRFIAQKPNMDMEQYNIDDNYSFLGQRTIGWGWIDNPVIFPLKDIIVLSTASNGNLTKFPINQGGDWDYGQIGVIGSGFGVYEQLFCYENSILGIDGGGYMWEIPISDAGVLGSKRQMGTGWDMYVKVFRAGSNLLALDSAGDLWRYNFNLNSAWPLVE